MIYLKKPYLKTLVYDEKEIRDILADFRKLRPGYEIAIKCDHQRISVADILGWDMATTLIEHQLGKDRKLYFLHWDQVKKTALIQISSPGKRDVGGWLIQIIVFIGWLDSQP
jgi:hypothetical protein|tara:strand:- start:556 stop:891 length:336 start_codon:yes stop_codon:yes gene_type:complete